MAKSNTSFTKGHIVPKEWRERLSNLYKGKHFSPKTEFKKGIDLRGRKNPMWGKRHTEEWKREMSKKMKGNKHCLGKKITEEHKKKISDANKGRVLTLETRKKISNANKGRLKSEEHKKKMSEVRRGKKLSQERKKRISASLQGISLEEWTGFKEKQERNDPAYRQWRNEVFKRDGFKCKINNKDCSGKIIVHHILGWSSYPELRYNINNGITLCQAHHPLKRAEEKRLVPFFQGLVPVSS